MRWGVLIGLLLLITSCQSVNLDETHPISEGMGCSPGDAINGSCELGQDNNAEIFGKISDDIGYGYLDDFPGFLARPGDNGTYPGVVMIHEWWGLNENIESMAKHLASQGYVVLAVDLYNGSVAEGSVMASELVSSVRNNQERATETLRGAVDYLETNYGVDSVGSIGWCFGGGQSLQLAISGEELDATVIYYGHLTSNRSLLDRIEWPVLGMFAENDDSIPPSAVNEFESILDDLNIQNEIFIYEGVDHAFANPSGSRFAPNATRDAWGKTLAFFDENLE